MIAVLFQQNVIYFYLYLVIYLIVCLTLISHLNSCYYSFMYFIVFFSIAKHQILYFNNSLFKIGNQKHV